jgi:O-antigen/teichoic acid export membrane protein
VLAFAIVPVVVGTLDREVYGVWTFLNSLAVYSNLFYLGLGAAFMKRLSEAVGRHDVAAQTRLLGVAWTLYLAIGLVCVAVSLVLAPNVPHFFATPISPAAEGAAAATTGLIGGRLFFMFVGSAFSALLASHGRWDLVSGVVIAGTVGRTAAVFWAMSRPNPLVTMAVVMLIDSVLQVGVLMGLCRLVAPEVRLRPTAPTREELADLYGFGFQAFFVQVALLLIAYTDTALIGVLLGAASVTVYALPLQLIEHSRTLVTGITQSLLPELAALRARGDVVRLRLVYLRASRIAAAMAAFVNVHLVVLGPSFLALWVGPGFEDDARKILPFLALAATCGALSTQVLNPFYQALDLLRTLVVIILVEAAVNIVLSVWFAQTLGVWGVALATAIPAVAITMVFAPRFMLARLDVSGRAFVQEVIGPAVALAAVSIAVQAALGPWVGQDSYPALVLRVACSTAVAVPIVFATFPRAEWLPIVARLAPALARRVQG